MQRCSHAGGRSRRGALNEQRERAAAAGASEELRRSRLSFDPHVLGVVRPPVRRRGARRVRENPGPKSGRRE